MANKKAKGKRARTRRKFKRPVRLKTTVNEILKPVVLNDVVQINVNSSVHAGLPNSRSHGKTGVVIGFQGDCPIVQIKDGNKPKKIITQKVHLRVLQQIPKGGK
jgi:large subunit ribosomal protein L21e